MILLSLLFVGQVMSLKKPTNLQMMSLPHGAIHDSKSHKQVPSHGVNSHHVVHHAGQGSVLAGYYDAPIELHHKKPVSSVKLSAGKSSGKGSSHLMVRDDSADSSLYSQSSTAIDGTSYTWNVTDWGFCDVGCGPGAQYRSVQCMSVDNSTIVPDSACLSDPTGNGTRPDMTRGCQGSRNGRS